MAILPAGVAPDAPPLLALPLIPASAQALAKSAVQMSLAFQNPSAMTVSFTLALVTLTGTNSTDGTSTLPLFTLPFTVAASGVLPASSVTASCADASASCLIALYTVMYCSPARIRWIAASSPSCPVTGGNGLIPAAFIAAIAPPPVPSLAASTPSNLLPSAVSACCISLCALSGLQSGVSYSLAILTLPSSTECAPALNSVALLSVGEPLIITTVAFAFPPSASSRLWPCSLPTCSLSNDR